MNRLVRDLGEDSETKNALETSVLLADWAGPEEEAEEDPMPYGRMSDGFLHASRS